MTTLLWALPLFLAVFFHARRNPRMHPSPFEGWGDAGDVEAEELGPAGTIRAWEIERHHINHGRTVICNRASFAKGGGCCKRPYEHTGMHLTYVDDQPYCWDTPPRRA